MNTVYGNGEPRPRDVKRIMSLRKQHHKLFDAIERINKEIELIYAKYPFETEGWRKWKKIWDV